VLLNVRKLEESMRVGLLPCVAVSALTSPCIVTATSPHPEVKAES
jgi:hypothetical protein